MNYREGSVINLPHMFGSPFLKNTAVILLLLMGFAINVQAETDIQQVIESSEKLIKQAKKFTQKGDFLEAEKVLRRALQTDPRNSKAKLNLAFNLLKQRRLLESYEYSFEVAKSEPNNAYAFAVLGTVFLTAGNFNEAYLSFNNALRIDKKEALAWAGLGSLKFYENKILLGLENLRTAVYFEPNEPDYLFTLAQISSRAEKYSEAADAYDKFLQVSLRTDIERRDRIKGLIGYLRFLGSKTSLYQLGGKLETVVSFKLINDRPIIQLKINKEEEPLNFVLDTGSGISVISDATAKKLNVKPVSRGGLAGAIGGEGKFNIVYGFLRQVSIGDVKIKNVPIYIREFHAKDEQINGYIGLALISKFLTTIDYGNSIFSLKRRIPAENNKDNSLLSLPLRLTSSGFLSGEVQLQGIETPLNFIVDTGASISVISAELANSKEIIPFLKKEKMRVIGAAGITENVSTFLLPRVTFGTHSRESIKAAALNLNVINESSGFQQAGILGGNFLKNYRLTFDFENSKVIFVPVK